MVEKKSAGSAIFDIVVLVLLLAITLSCILPVWYILMLSLSSREAVNAGRVSFWPQGLNLLSYETIMGDKAFFASFFTSVKRVLLGTGVGMSAMLLMAFPLSRNETQLPHRNKIMWTLVFCMLFSGGVIPLFLAVQRYGLINSVWSLVLAGGLPVFNTILIVNFFRNLPPSLEEAACVDGAGVWRVFFQIFLPLSGPVIATVTLFMVMGHWNEFFHGLIFTTKQAKYPLQTYIQQMVVTVNISQVTDIEQLQKQAMLNNKSLDAAKIFIAMIPVLVVYPFLQRYFVTGITLGSVKE